MGEENQHDKVYGKVVELADCHLPPVGDGSALDVCGDLETALYAAIALVPSGKLQSYWLDVKALMMERHGMEEEEYQAAIELRRHHIDLYKEEEC